MVPSVETAAGISENVQPYLRGRVFSIDLTTPGQIDTLSFDQEVLKVGGGQYLKWMATASKVWMFSRRIEHADVYDMLPISASREPILSAGLYDLIGGENRTFFENSSTLARKGIITKEASNKHKTEVLGPALGSEFTVY